MYFALPIIHMKKVVYLFLFALVVNAGFLCTPSSKYRALQEKGLIPHSNVRADLSALASDEMEGRGVGTDAERRAGEFIAKRFESIGLTPKGEEGWFQTFKFVPHSPMQIHHNGDSASLGMGLVKEISGRNVIGYLDNGSANTVVIGAHYDHLGYGDENSLWTGDKAIHNGADDNGSGTAALIDLASWLMSKPAGTTSNNYLFIAFSGEEKGLWGSNHFTKNPTIELAKMNYMINMDMVGRLNAEKKLAINGVGTSPAWMSVLPQISVDGIQIVTSESGVGPSDHTSFYLSDIPAIHFFTGQHEDYHKPTDDTDKINFEGLTSVINYIHQVIIQMDGKGKIAFTKTKEEKSASASDFKVTLGVVPDYLYSDIGLRIDGTKEGRPGEKAGLIKGDIILKLGDYDIKDIYGYMEALSKFEKGQKSTIELKRNGEMITLEVIWE